MSSTRSSGCNWSVSSILATTSGWEIVWPQAIGSATFSYARDRSLSGTNRSRGIAAIAPSTRSSPTADRNRTARAAASAGPMSGDCARFAAPGYISAAPSAPVTAARNRAA